MSSNIFYGRQAESVMVGSLWPTLDALDAGTLDAGTKNKHFFISRNTMDRKKVRVHLYSNTCMPSNIFYGHQAVPGMIGSLWLTLDAGTLDAGTKIKKSLSPVIFALKRK